MGRLISNGHGKTLLLIISLAFNLGACLAVAVQARDVQQDQRSRKGRRGHHGKMTERLNLTPEQEEIISASRRELFERIRGFKQPLREEGGRLADLLTADELDMDAVSAQVERVADARNAIQWHMIEHLLSVREVLEPEQLEAFREFAGRVLAWPEGGRSRGGRSHRGGGPPREP